jgi:hypothetical protein
MKKRSGKKCKPGYWLFAIKLINANVPVMIDAEESWIQDTIDGLALI